MSKRVLVTGANGQLGKTIEELYCKNTLDLDFVFVSKQGLDITDEAQITSFFESQNFDYCINCAAYTNVEQAEKTPEIAFKVNAEAVKYLAEECEKNNTILIHISTDYVFDGEKSSPYTVDDKPNPINEYGKSKLLGEQYIQGTLEQYFVIRTSWLYSEIYGKNFYKSILKKAKEGHDLSVTTEQMGCPTNTITLSHFIYDLIKSSNSKFGIYHFCDEEKMTWYDFARKILEENNLYNSVKLVEAKNYRTFAERPKNSVLSKSI